MTDVTPTPDPAPAPEPTPEEVTPLVGDTPPAVDPPSPEDVLPASEEDPSGDVLPETTVESGQTGDTFPTDGATGQPSEVAPEVAPPDPSSGVASEPAAPVVATPSPPTPSSSSTRFRCNTPDCPQFDAEITVALVVCPTCKGTSVVRSV